ncbi:transmembrane protein 273 isoform X4 [Cavia porcellus]|uniref:transmembrane protein 273 isoform X4 n=1 Tax=Cavia porcellus TaxID=10141 RepID=UPI002FE29477
MSPGVRVLRALLFLLGVGGARVLATGESAEAEVDFKYALIGTALGVAICVGFLVLKICMIRKHLSDQDSAELRSTARGVTDPFVQRKKRSLSMREARVIELGQVAEAGEAQPPEQLPTL